MAQGFGAPSLRKTSGSQSASTPTVVETETVQQQWLDQFSGLTDPRGKQGVEHPLLSIVMIAILGVIGGATGWEDIQTYGESHATWLSTFLSLPAGIPSADTYRRVFERLDPQALERCFLGWVEQIVEATGAQVIPIDGKTVKGSYDRTSGRKALHVVSAWASEHRLLLGQVQVESKTNEITAIPSLLELLDIRGSIITLDAMGTQVAIARQIRAQGGDYLLALNDHPRQYFSSLSAANAGAGAG
jgi:hypothetical protein